MRPILWLALVLIAPQATLAKPLLRGSQGNYVVTEFVATTPQRAWAILSNFNNQAEWAPDISQAKVISRSGNNLELQQTYRARYTFGLPIKAKLSISEQPPKGFSYRLISGDRLNSLQGRWSITPVAQGSSSSTRCRWIPRCLGPCAPSITSSRSRTCGSG